MKVLYSTVDGQTQAIAAGIVNQLQGVMECDLCDLEHTISA